MTAVTGIIHLIVLLSGLCSLASCVLQPQFAFFQTPKTWNEAQSFCREKGFDLATMNDMRDMETVRGIVQDKYDDGVWIGLRRGQTEKWHWSLAGTDFYKEGWRNDLIWGSEPGNVNCGTFKDGKLYADLCPNARFSVCFDGTKQGADQFVVIRTNLNWIEAREYCRIHHTDLASLRNDAEYQMMTELTNGLNVWIGLFRDHWEWSNQSDSSLRYWKEGQPVWSPYGKNCVALLRQESSRWGEVSCTTTNPFLCSGGIKLTFIKVRISLQDSGLDLSDPSVQDSILEQMRQKLSANMTDVPVLRWKKQADGRVFVKEPQRND